MMQQGQNRRKQPQPLFKVDWMSKESDALFSKPFHDVNEAIAFAKNYKYAIVSKQVKASKEGFKYEIVPTLSARELRKNIMLRKALDKKNGFYNADGVSETEVTSTAQVKASQTVRLVNMFVYTPVLIYAGTRKELPTWLRYGLFAIAGLNFLTNAKNYTTNSKIEKLIQEAEENDEE